MSAGDDWLPDLIRLEEYGGDWHRYLEAIYESFCLDFVVARPTFEGKRIALKRHPLLEGKEATFWHLISQGHIEAERLPDLRRCERIRWPRAIIDAASTGAVKRWRNTRQGDPRIVVALDDFSYVVVLADRGNYVLLWTAYCVENEHRRRALQKEWEAYERSQKG